MPALLAQLTKVPDEPMGDALELQVAMHGALAAGWLVFEHRRRFHATGRILFRIPRAAETPPWFRVAFQFLKRRKLWEVDLVKTDKERVYGIRWLGWRTYKTAG